jgi:hypothetical protein
MRLLELHRKPMSVSCGSWRRMRSPGKASRAAQRTGSERHGRAAESRACAPSASR